MPLLMHYGGRDTYRPGPGGSDVRRSTGLVVLTVILPDETLRGEGRPSVLVAPAGQ